MVSYKASNSQLLIHRCLTGKCGKSTGRRFMVFVYFRLTSFFFLFSVDYGMYDIFQRCPWVNHDKWLVESFCCSGKFCTIVSGVMARTWKMISCTHRWPASWNVSINSSQSNLSKQGTF